MAAVRRSLARALPDIEITEYDAEQQGSPASDFRWDLYDAALLSHELGDLPRGLAWLERYRGLQGFPPTVLVAAGGDAYLAVAAMKAGAADYLRREDALSERLPLVLSTIARSPLALESTLYMERGACRALDDSLLLKRSLPDDTSHRFVRLIGQGGFSRVYLAERESDGSPVVLKIIDTRQGLDPAMLRRFIREAEIMASITDPFVVKVFGQGLTANYGYISMEFFPGGDLKQRIERGLSIPDAIDCMRGIARGLRAIHQRSVIHRDLKPGNIMFRADHSLALADFGISRRVSESLDLTTTTGTLGTPGYISPEQALGTPVDHRTDLYSAGIIFYELLTGRKPFRAESPAGLVYQHIHSTPPALPAAVALAQPIIDMLLAKDPEARFGSAEELLDSLEDWLAGPAWRALSPPQAYLSAVNDA